MQFHLDAGGQTITIHLELPRRCIPSLAQLLKFATLLGSWPAVSYAGHFSAGDNARAPEPAQQATAPT